MHKLLPKMIVYCVYWFILLLGLSILLSLSKVNDYRYLVLISRSLTLFVELKIKVQFFVVMKGHNFRFQSEIASITKYLYTNIKVVLFFMPQAHVVKVLPGLQIIFLCQTKYYHRRADDNAFFRDFLGKRKRKFIWS